MSVLAFEMTFDALSGKVDLTVDQHAVEAKRIGDHVKIQESADFMIFSASISLSYLSLMSSRRAPSCQEGRVSNRLPTSPVLGMQLNKEKNFLKKFY